MSKKLIVSATSPKETINCKDIGIKNDNVIVVYLGSEVIGTVQYSEEEERYIIVTTSGIVWVETLSEFVDNNPTFKFVLYTNE